MPPGSRRSFRVTADALGRCWFEVEATAYVGGRTHFRLEAEYELLLTNRLILQPLVEAELYEKSDAARWLVSSAPPIMPPRRARAPAGPSSHSRSAYGSSRVSRAACAAPRDRQGEAERHGHRTTEDHQWD